MPEKKQDIPDSYRWSLISKNLKAWYLSWPSANSATLFLSDPSTLLTPERATTGSSDLGDERIDAILKYYRSEKSTKEILIWYLNSSPPEVLNAKLLARGVGVGWRVEWMWCDLTSSPPAPHPLAVDVEISTSKLEDSKKGALPHQYLLSARILDLTARIVGNVTLNLTPNLNSEAKDMVAGGLFSMSVLPSVRNRGIGTKLAEAACNLARDLGVRFLYLTATTLGSPVYEKVGFEKMCEGIVWRLDRNRCAGCYDETRPRREVVRFLEAICLGNTDVLEESEREVGVEEMQRPTGNGMTALEMAVSCGQTKSAEWLVGKGVVGDVLSYWNLGWKDKARELVSRKPEVVNVKEGRSGALPLQIAIERDDQQLAALLAGVAPRVERREQGDIRDIDWGKHFEI